MERDVWRGGTGLPPSKMVGMGVAGGRWSREEMSTRRVSLERDSKLPSTRPHEMTVGDLIYVMRTACGDQPRVAGEYRHPQLAASLECARRVGEGGGAAFTLTKETEKGAGSGYPPYTFSNPAPPVQGTMDLQESEPPQRMRTPSGNLLQGINPLIYLSNDDKKTWRMMWRRSSVTAMVSVAQIYR
ncbi:hypothetical protein GWK47_054871 [Chionoecetes opilio]|uniref:Uncharacterized protein n=1 Tax=Chionoecetes opilio TaxID=41210 RepID=A0A8J5C6L0_CHIOP|nr:hypothetical protein GWK47_054871 [Chionoecetes opilio]